MLKVTALTCEYRKDPIGIDSLHPRISWMMESDHSGVLQVAYRLQVSLRSDFQPVIWDTGVVLSDQSVHITYQGPNLEPGTRYYYRVCVEDNHGDTSGWSETAFWETGLLTPDNWVAKWIWSGSAEEEKLEASPLLQKNFVLDKPVSSARIYATALGLYELHLNGKRVGDARFTPGWTSYGQRLQYQAYDVTPLLSSGDNTLNAVLGNGWYAGYIAWQRGKGFYGNTRALLLQLHIRYEDGTETRFGTDETWQTAWGPIRMSEIYHGEDYDARLEEGPFAWQPAAIYEYPTNMVVAQENNPAKIMEEIKPVRVFVTPEGDKVLDFGQNMVGFVCFSVTGPRGTRVSLRHAEVLDANGNFYTENLKGARQMVTYTLKGEAEEVFCPHFTYQGFRYVCVEGYPGELKAEKFTGCVVYSAMNTTGSFRCSDEMVNQLQRNILWGQKGNFLEAPTDCPQRDERHGWTGDAQMFIRTACFNMDVALFFEKWLADLATDQKKLSGGVPYVVPNVREPKESSSAAWGDAATICPWTLYLCYGDPQILQQQYESMKNWVDFVYRQGDDPYLWNTGFHFGDWLALDNGPGSWIGATATDLIATAFYANSVELVAKAAGVLQLEEDVAYYTALHEKILEHFQAEFVTPGGRLVSDTQTAHVLVLMFRLLQEKDRHRAAARLVQLLGNNQDHLNTGFVGTPYLCHVLSRNGYNDLAYKLLLHRDCPSWLYPITKGATTIWEHWDGIRQDGSFWDKVMNSFNHYSYGAVGDWLYRVVAGLDVDEEKPGYKHCRIHPRPGAGLTFAEASYQSLYGEIWVRWERTDREMVISLQLPVNTTATVTLPGATLDRVKANGKALTEACLLSAPVQVCEGVKLSVGSGNHSFVYCQDP